MAHLEMNRTPREWRRGPSCRLSLVLLCFLLACADDAKPGIEDADTGEPPRDTSYLDAQVDTHVDDTDGEDTLGDAEVDAGPDVEEYIELGKTYLSQARPVEALEAFEMALQIDPDHTDALFGAALAELVDAAEMSAMVLTLAEQMTYMHIWWLEPPPSQNEWAAEKLHQILMGLRAKFERPQERLDRLVDRPLHFEVTNAYLFLDVHPRLNYRGVFDNGDVHLMSAINNFILFVFDVLAGQDLTTDVFTAISLARGSFDFSFYGIGQVFAYLLNQDERFMTLHPVDGETLFFDSRERIAAVGPHLRKAIEIMAAETDAEQDVSTVRLGADEDHFTVVVRNFVVQTEEGAYEEVPYEMELTAQMVTAFERWSEVVDMPGEVVRCDEVCSPILAVTLSVGLSLGLLDPLVGALPIDLSGLGPEPLMSLLSALIPSLVGFDWGTFFQQPTGLRLFMPRVTTDQPPGENVLQSEWECPEEVGDGGLPGGWNGFVCSDTATIEDSPHFVGTPYEIEADGYATIMFHLIFDDPTFGGLIHVDLSPLVVEGEPYEPGLVPADLKTLNLAIAASFEQLFGLLPD